MGIWRKCAHTVCGTTKSDEGGPHAIALLPTPTSWRPTHIHNVQLGQQAAVSQCELVTIQESAPGLTKLWLLGQFMV